MATVWMPVDLALLFMVVGANGGRGLHVRKHVEAEFVCEPESAITQRKPIFMYIACTACIHTSCISYNILYTNFLYIIIILYTYFLYVIYTVNLLPVCHIYCKLTSCI